MLHVLWRVVSLGTLVQTSRERTCRCLHARLLAHGSGGALGDGVVPLVRFGGSWWGCHCPDREEAIHRLLRSYCLKVPEGAPQGAMRSTGWGGDWEVSRWRVGLSGKLGGSDASCWDGQVDTPRSEGWRA